MTDLGELAHRLASGEVLEGEDAQTIMGVATEAAPTEAAPWQLWIYVALAYLELGKPDRARSVLEQLIEREADITRPALPAPWPGAPTP